MIKPHHRNLTKKNLNSPAKIDPNVLDLKKSTSQPASQDPPNSEDKITNSVASKT
jgi:hypothetical protein